MTSSLPEDDVGKLPLSGDLNIVTHSILKQDPKIAAAIKNSAFEEHLVKQAKRGINSAFENLYRRYI